MKTATILVRMTIKVQSYCLHLLRCLPNICLEWEDVIQSIDAAYDEVIRWKHYFFLTPSGKSGGKFASEMARLFCSYGEWSALESIAINAAMVLPHLLLQKSYPLAKTWDHVERLQRYLSLWKTDDINNLLIEVRTIQRCHQQNNRNVFTDNKDRAPHHFAINKTISLNQHSTTVYNELVRKHLPSQPAHQDSLLPSTTPRTSFHYVVHCVCGPTGNCFTHTQPSDLTWKKLPGLQPIGVGETIRRIMGKASSSSSNTMFFKRQVRFSCVKARRLEVKLSFMQCKNYFKMVHVKELYLWMPPMHIIV